MRWAGGAFELDNRQRRARMGLALMGSEARTDDPQKALWIVSLFPQRESVISGPEGISVADYDRDSQPRGSHCGRMIPTSLPCASPRQPAQPPPQAIRPTRLSHL